MVVECALAGEGGSCVGKHARQIEGIPVGVSPIGDHEVVEDKELEGHQGHRVVKRIPQPVEELGKSFHLEHLSQYQPHLLQLAASVVGLPLDQLHLQSLQRVGDQLSGQHRQVDRH